MALSIFFSDYRWPVLMPIHKSTQAQVSFWSILYLFTGQTRSMLMSFCYTRTGSYHHILDRLSYTMWIVKRILMMMMLQNIHLIIWYISSSSYISAVNGTTRSPVAVAVVYVR